MHIQWNLSITDTLIGTLILVLITEVSSIQRSFSTPQYYTGTQNGVLIIEVSAIQRFVIERFHCNIKLIVTHAYIHSILLIQLQLVQYMSLSRGREDQLVVHH